ISFESYDSTQIPIWLKSATAGTDTGRVVGRALVPPRQAGASAASALRTTDDALLLQQHVLHRPAGRNHRQHVFGVGRDDVEDERAVVVQHFLDRGAQLAFLDHATAFYAEAFGDLDEVGIKRVGIVGAADVALVAEDGVAADAAVEAILPLHHHAEMLVVQDHRLRGDVLDLRGG